MCLRCAYQAKVMKTFDNVSNTMARRIGEFMREEAVSGSWLARQDGNHTRSITQPWEHRFVAGTQDWQCGRASVRSRIDPIQCTDQNRSRVPNRTRDRKISARLRHGANARE